MGALGKIYLCAYNLAQTIGWSVVLYTLLSHYTSSTSEITVWDKVWVPLFIFQNAAVLEVLHTMIGLVRANPFITFTQVLSRVMVCGILLSIPQSQIVSSFAFPLTVISWSITEIVRYLFYFVNLIGCVPYFLTWLRYSLFLGLYPSGISGELLCYYLALKHSMSHPETWTYALPNTWNFTFNYCYFLIICMLTYIPGSVQMYTHMLSQRKKVLGSEVKTKKGQ